MVGLAVTFDLGRYHATPWGAHVNEARTEWPPSPWRILRALLAASHAHVEPAAHRDAVDRALAALASGPPPRYALPRVTAAHTRHYFPLPDGAKTSLVIDAFLALDPDDELRVIWDVQLDADEREALECAAAALGTLGRSEAVCTVRLDDDPLPDDVAHAVPLSGAAAPPDWAADAQRVDMWTVEPGHGDPVGVLGISVTDMRRARRLVPPGAQRVTYALRAPEDLETTVACTGARPTLAHLRVAGGGRPALSQASVVASVLRASLQRRFDHAREGARSESLSGHDPAGGMRRDQHRHAHYLVGSDPGIPRTDHLWVWAPEGLGPGEVAAIAGLRELRLRDAPEPVRVALVALGTEATLELPALLGPATEWRSATPFILPRHEKRRGGRTIDGPEDQLRRELAHRGFPEPLHVELVPGKWLDFALARPGTSRTRAGRAVGARMQFAEPVRGPIVLGGLSHFGLGRFVPIDP